MLGGGVEIPSSFALANLFKNSSARNEVKGSTALALDLKEALTIKALGATPRRSLPQIGKARRKERWEITPTGSQRDGKAEGQTSTPTHRGPQTDS